MSRSHPFDLVLGDLADQVFPGMDREVGAEPLDIASFTRLPSTEAILKQLGSPELAEEDAAALEEYIRLLLVAFLFWRNGTRTVGLSRAALEPALDGGPRELGAKPLMGAAYYELPEHWIWGQIGEGAPHEPVEGMFIAPIAAGTVIVAILGLRREREGFSQISAIAAPEDFATAAGAIRTPPFAPTMPGGLEAGFRTIASEGELIRLAHLAMLCEPQ